MLASLFARLSSVYSHMHRMPSTDGSSIISALFELLFPFYRDKRQKILIFVCCWNVIVFWYLQNLMLEILIYYLFTFYAFIDFFLFHCICKILECLCISLW